MTVPSLLAPDGVLRSLYRRVVPLSLRREVRRVTRSLRRRGRTKASPAGKVQAQKHLLQEAKGLLSEWKLEEALTRVEAALEIDPTLLRALQLRAHLLSCMGRLDEAREAAWQTVRLYPLNAAGRRQLRALGEVPPTVTRESALELITASRYSVDTIAQAVTCLYDAELFEDSLELCSLGLVAASRLSEGRRTRIWAQFMHARGLALEALHRHDEAIRTWEALLSDPSCAVVAATGLARCYFEAGSPEKAEQTLSAATPPGPNGPPFSPFLFDVFQASERIRDSYELYRKRPISMSIASFFGCPPPTQLTLDDPINRTRSALVLLEGGPGDELRFSSLYPALASRFARLTLTCDPRLHGILQRSFPEIDFLPTTRHRREFVRRMDDRTLVPNGLLVPFMSDDVVRLGRGYDLVCSLLDTLADLRPNRKSFRLSEPRLLRPRDDLRLDWQQHLAPRKLRIGLAWRSMLQTVARNRHYCRIEHLRPLTEIPNVEFWCLQPDADPEELHELTPFLPIRIPTGLDLIDDLEGQLALISCLDWVISPFTTTGELAGAAGTRTILVSTTRNTSWRRNPDGTDVWRQNVTIVHGNPLHDKESGIAAAVEVIRRVELESAQSAVSA
jgi:tetratricopeptide (TPR) repeat protein